MKNLVFKTLFVCALLCTASNYSMLSKKQKKNNTNPTIVAVLEQDVANLATQFHTLRTAYEGEHQTIGALSARLDQLQTDVTDLIQIFKTNKNLIDLSPSALAEAKKDLTQKLAKTKLLEGEENNQTNMEFAKQYLSDPTESTQRIIFTNIMPEQIDTMVKALRNPEEFKLYVPTKQLNLFLYGPPGGGKTTVARFLARETNRLFFNITSGQMQDIWVSAGAKNVTKLIMGAYHLAKQNKEGEKSKAIIFIDEIDALFPSRISSHNAGTCDSNKTVAAFLGLIDGFSEDISNRLTIIGATNKPEHVDDAVISRLGQRINIINTLEQKRSFITSELSLRPKLEPLDTAAITILIIQDKSCSSFRDVCTVLNNAGMKAFNKGTMITIQDVKNALEEQKIKK